MSKPKLAVYWAASCGGCEIAFLDIREKIIEVDKAADIVFCPCIMDTKYKDVEEMANGEIDVCLFNGAIRNDENLHMARLLRKKSKILVAFGSCATEGCIPGLGNLTTKRGIIDYVYHQAPSNDNKSKTEPKSVTKTKNGDLSLPELFSYVRTLDQVVDIDYRMPGCPPVADQIWNVLEAVLSENLPPKGAVIGVNPKTVCDECPREKSEDKVVKKFVRPHMVKEIDPDKCLLDQGIICNGPATRAGCGALCTQVNLGCRGCYGPAEGIDDIGGKLAGAIASMVDSNDPEEIEKIVNEIPDPVGTFYRFNLPGSIIGRKI
ncbi:oxidoreductase [candidate division KSB1 bacterium]|nr:MAG: oxidoreductase [candidate division KSB1 bacterium]